MQSVEGAVSFLLTVFSQIRGERQIEVIVKQKGTKPWEILNIPNCKKRKMRKLASKRT